MRSRLDRARRAARSAERVEDEARLGALRANQQLEAARAAIGEAAARTGQVVGTGLPPGLRCMLTTAGARNLLALGRERDRRQQAAAESTHRWEETRQRARSLQKRADRLEAADRTQRRRAEMAELLDIVSSATVAGAPGSSDGWERSR
jgi:hypothetical protein